MNMEMKMSLILQDYRFFMKKYFIIRHNYSHVHYVPHMSLNISHEMIMDNKRNLAFILGAMKVIIGQDPSITFAKKSIANFNLKKNMALGSKFSLIKEKLHEFLFKLKTTIFPFSSFKKKNLSKAGRKSYLDSQGNYNFGVINLLLVPDINYCFEYFNKDIGMNINFVHHLNEYARGLHEKIWCSCYEIPF